MPKVTKRIHVKIASFAFIFAILCSFLLYSSSGKYSYVLSFEANQDKDITYQVYYTGHLEEKFNERHSVKQLNKAGNTCVSIVIPTKKIKKIRLDLGRAPQKIILKNLVLQGQEKLAFKDIKEFTLQNLELKQASNGTAEILSTHNDPMMIYKNQINFKGHLQTDYLVLGIIFVLSFFISYKILAYLLKFKLLDKNSRIDIVFISVFFILLLVPISQIDNHKISTQENRTLAQYKPLVDNRGGYNYGYGKDFEKWFNDHFNKRELYIEIHGKIERFINKDLRNADAMRGKDNWFFTTRWNSVDTFQNKKLYTAEELELIKENVEGIKKWANANGIKFYLFLSPDKERIYPEYYPDGYEKVRKESRIMQTYKFIRDNTDVDIAYPYHELIAAKQNNRLYYKTGTHWNHQGAFIGYQKIMNLVRKDFPELKIMSLNDFDIKSEVKSDVDIAAALGVNAYNVLPKEDLTNDIFYLKSPTIEQEHMFLNKEKRIEIFDFVSKDKSKKLKGIIYADSFVLRMNWYMAESFAQFKHIYTGYGRDFDVNYMSEHIKSMHPDVLIIQTTERFLDRLLRLQFPEIN